MCEKVVCERVVCEKVYVSSVEMVEERLCERAMSAKTVAPRQSPAQNGSGCFQMPRLREPSAPPEPAQCRKCHARHTEWKSMLPNATTATQTAVAPTGTKHATRASPVP